MRRGWVERGRGLCTKKKIFFVHYPLVGDGVKVWVGDGQRGGEGMG